MALKHVNNISAPYYCLYERPIARLYCSFLTCSMNAAGLTEPAGDKFCRKFDLDNFDFKRHSYLQQSSKMRGFLLNLLQIEKSAKLD